MNTSHMVPSVEDAGLRYASAARDLYCVGDIDGCEDCQWSALNVERAALALDMALSVGRQFDRAEQQRRWQAREDAALTASVAW